MTPEQTFPISRELWEFIGLCVEYDNCFDDDALISSSAEAQELHASLWSAWERYRKVNDV